jgi:epoxide hydrolase 4
MFHGLQDRALHSDALSGTWQWVDKDLTIVTIPTAGHFVQQDAAEFVTRTMQSWLDQRRP